MQLREEEPDSETCDFCGKICTSFDHLLNHVLVHTERKPYRCDICETRFTDLELFMLHVRDHEMLHESHACD